MAKRHYSNVCADPNQAINYALDRSRLVNGYQIATGDGECPVRCTTGVEGLCLHKPRLIHLGRCRGQVAWSLETSRDGASGGRWDIVDHQEAQSCHDGDFIVYQMEAPVQAQYFRFQCDCPAVDLFELTTVVPFRLRC